MSKRVVPFRRIKHGDPDRMKVLAEDLRPTKRAALPFVALVAICAALAFVGAYLVG